MVLALPADLRGNLLLEVGAAGGRPDRGGVPARLGHQMHPRGHPGPPGGPAVAASRPGVARRRRERAMACRGPSGLLWNGLSAWARAGPLSHDDESSYQSLGGVGLPRVYADAIKNDCRVCLVKAGELCLDERGQTRHRPHGSRMMVVTGGS